MKVTVDSKKGLKTNLKVFVDKKTIEEKIDARLNELRKTVNIKGFRPGKVPVDILKNNGLVFQAQVAYLIPIFGVILGYLFLNEVITLKVIISLIAVIIGIYIVKKGGKVKVV